MSLNRGRLIIGERPAQDMIQCLRCRRKWDATDQPGEPESCSICGVPWSEPLEWDRTTIIRRVWYIEWRWRDGFGFGPWHTTDVVPGTVTPDEIDDLLVRFRDAENARHYRVKSVLRFEYRAVSALVEVYQPPRRVNSAVGKK